MYHFDPQSRDRVNGLKTTPVASPGLSGPDKRQTELRCFRYNRDRFLTENPAPSGNLTGGGATRMRDSHKMDAERERLVRDARRVVIKVGTATVTGAEGELCLDRVEPIVRSIAALM